MNSDSDYLWDKTGEPDPETQQLEEILGTLRYQPRPLEIPAGVQVGRERNFFRGSAPRLAIAATIAMLLLGLGLWLGLQRWLRSQSPEIVKTPGTPAVNPVPMLEPSPNQDQSPKLASDNGSDRKRIGSAPRHRVNQSLLARDANRVRHEGNKNQQLTANKLQEAEAAKDQLILALRVASAKLSFAQKKAQGVNQRDQVHNQHKIG
jgi:hypothetical protein